MKLLSLFALCCCLFFAGCANPAKQPAQETGNGLGGSDVGNAFPGSVGAGNRAATGSNAGVRSGTADPH